MSLAMEQNQLFCKFQSIFFTSISLLCEAQLPRMGFVTSLYIYIYIIMQQAPPQIQPINQPILQDRVQNIAQQQIWKQKNFNDLNKQVPLPIQTEKQVKQIIDRSKQELLEVAAKQKQVLVQKKKIQQKAIEQYTSDSFLTIDNMSVDAYNNLSIIPQIGKFVYSKIANLIQIQAEIDPVTMKLIQIKGVKVIDIVTDLLRHSTLQYKFSKVLGLYQSDSDKVQQMTDFIRSVLTKVYDECMKMDFAVLAKDMKEAVLNEKVYKNTKRDHVILMQTQALRARAADNKKSRVTQSLNTHLNYVFIKLLKKKREQYRKIVKKQFWQVIPQDTKDLTDIIQQQMTNQIDGIKKARISRQTPTVSQISQFWGNIMMDEQQQKELTRKMELQISQAKKAAQQAKKRRELKKKGVNQNQGANK